MPRGFAAKDGATRVSTNGYHYTRVGGIWRLTHHIIVEETLGRQVDTAKDFVRFKDGDKTNLEPENIEVIPKNKSTIRRRVAELEARIEELTRYKEDLSREMLA